MEMAADFIISLGLPLTFFGDRCNADLLAYLNSDVKPISTKATIAKCLEMYERERAKLKHALGSIPGRFCLTCDIWADPCTTEYLCLTVNYVDSNWKLQSKFLNLVPLPFPWDASILRSAVNNLLCKWGIEKNVFSITFDSGRCGDTVLDMLRDCLNEQDGALLCNGDYFRVCCGAYFMDHMVQECFKLIDSPIRKIGLGVQYVLYHEKNRLKFEEAAKFIFQANLYFINILKTGMLLVDATKDKDLEISNLARRMKSEFDVYWDACNEVFALAVIFDPRYKLSFVKFCYGKLDKASAEDRYVGTRRRLDRLFKTYSDQVFASQLNEMNDDILKEFGKDCREKEYDLRSSLNMYLNEPSISCHAQMDVLSWWKENEHRFGQELSLMARDILSIPITSFPKGSVFGMGYRVEDRLKGKWSSNHVEALIATRNWLYGYPVEEDYPGGLMGREERFWSTTCEEESD
ncbi:hypothetical protein BVRB_2g028530 isoform A [Beta vulgaris subsp. vulgaris]|nr:hypothetical protein BVRB_2g028530 isoform A [Beta vulgaris subsp. vulgaris]